MKELSYEKRLLLALVLSTVVMIVWGLFIRPPVRPRQEQPQPPSAAAPSAPSAPGTIPPAVPIPSAAPASSAIAAPAEANFVLESSLYRVELSNRGAVARSWQLLRFRDDSKPPRTLDVVDRVAAEQLRAWPLSFVLDDPQLEQQLNQALFVASPAENSLRAPAEIAFEWSDGRLAATKRLKFSEGYLVEIESSVSLDGRPLPHALAWRSGFGDFTAYAHTQNVRVLYRSAGSVSYLETKKLGRPEHSDQRQRYDATLDYAGIEDRYFVAVFLPRGSGLAMWHWNRERETIEKEKKEKVQVAEMAAGSTLAGPLALRLVVAPKDLEVLGGLNPPMTELVDFGWDWLEIFSKPLFYLLKWINGYVRNYGWSIILMTIAINMLLFPLKVKSWRQMQKMQSVMPEIQAIKQKYAKYPLRDPRRQQEGQETWALYRREGVNPAGGCLPMLIQMPIWMALYQMLLYAIELRHARWFLWIRDLSAPDRWFILPVLMALTMYVMQKMTPVTTPDPVQQRMMNFMPIMFGATFVIFPISSGLVLYILSSNLVAMGQQWYLNRTSPPTTSALHQKKKKR